MCSFICYGKEYWFTITLANRAVVRTCRSQALVNGIVGFFARNGEMLPVHFSKIRLQRTQERLAAGLLMRR